MTLTEAGWRLVPYTDTLHRQIDEARTDARAGFQVSVGPMRVAAIHIAVPHCLLRLDRGDLRAAQRWTVQLTSESLAGCERLIGDGRAQFRLARSQPAPPSGWTLTCSARRWSGSMSWRWTAPGGCESIRPAPFEGEEHEP